MQFFRAQHKMRETLMRKEVFTQDGFENFASRLGVGYDVNNSLSKGGYLFNMLTRNRVELEAAYRGSWIVGKMVDSIAEDMARSGIDVDTTDAKAEVSDVLAQMEKVKVWSSICDNEKWGRLYGGSIGVMQIEGQDMSTPLRLETIQKGQFKGVVVYDRWQVNPVMSDLIDEGPDLGLPRIYQIVTSPVNVMPTGDQLMTGIQNVHHSRCIRSIGIKLPFWQAITEMMWGESVLERLWDRLIAFDNATMSAASLVDRANLRQVGVEGFREIIGAGGDAYDGLIAQFEMMREFQTNEGLTLMDKNDTYQTTAYSFAGLPETLLQFAQQLAGASDIPLVRLLGQSPAGLSGSGEGDMRIYYDGINAKQETHLRQPVDILLRVLWRSVHGKAAPKDLKFTFTALWQMTAKDKADNAKTNAEAIVGAYDSGVIDRATALEELRTSGADTGVFSHITDDQIMEADEESDPPPGEEDLPGTETAANPDLKLLQGGLNPSAPDPKVKPTTQPVKTLNKAFGDVARAVAVVALFVAHNSPLR